MEDVKKEERKKKVCDSEGEKKKERDSEGKERHGSEIETYYRN